MRALGFHLSPEEVEDLVGEHMPGKEVLSQEDLMQVVAIVMEDRDWKDELLETFRAFSSNGRSITLKDLRRVAKEIGESLTEYDLQIIMEETDLNGNGEIDEDEWIRIMTKMVGLFTCLP
ncbi:Centrin-1 [Quaeritorhiza haematococci]|nr:Centrin-1 [Quaeritorhiza haematococci]